MANTAITVQIMKNLRTKVGIESTLPADAGTYYRCNALLKWAITCKADAINVEREAEMFEFIFSFPAGSNMYTFLKPFL